MSWPEHGSYQHGVQEGARQILAGLYRLLVTGSRFDQVAQHVADLHARAASGDFLGIGLVYNVPARPESKRDEQEP